ncbi:MAG: hypothetical protein ACI9OJ_002677 [Myxococcota bacterium]|jgi:hypothetical protein
MSRPTESTTTAAGLTFETACDWMPDLFAWLCDRLNDTLSVVVSAGWAVHSYRELPSLCVALAASEGGRTPGSVVDYLKGLAWESAVSVGSDDLAQRRFVVARAIDEVCGAIHPSWTLPSPPPGLRVIQAWFWGTGRGRYNRVAGGFVIPQTPLYPHATPKGQGAGDRLATLFLHLHRVTGFAPGVHVDFGRIPSRDDFGPDDLGVIPVVAVAPIAEHIGDLTFTSVTRAALPCLDVTPTAEFEDRFEATVPRLLASVDDQNAAIAVFPEWVMTPRMVDCLRSALRSNVIRNENSSLRMVVAGSGPTVERCSVTGLSYNESVVLSAAGRVLWRQRKLNHYWMDVGLMRRLGLETVADSAHMENIATGRELVVRDGAVGRMMVLICEDLATPRPGLDALTQLGPDWVFVPILDRELSAGRWVHQHGFPNAVRFGANAIIATSMVLPLREGVSGDAVGVGMCIGAGRGRVKILSVPANADEPSVSSVAWRPEGWAKTRVMLTEPS